MNILREKKVIITCIQNEPIELIELNKVIQRNEALVQDSGAFLLFCGKIRSKNKDKQVIHLEYDAHLSLAKKCLQNLAEEYTKKYNLDLCYCIHRIGKVLPQEIAVAVITGAKHRKENYLANQSLIDKIKITVPIWKKEVYADNSYEWSPR